MIFDFKNGENVSISSKNAPQNDFSAKPNVSDYSEGLESGKEGIAERERERGRERERDSEYARRCACDALNFDSKKEPLGNPFG